MTDTQGKIICPACGIEMTKVYLEEQGMFIDICDNGCGGMFFDNRELKNFNEHENNALELKKYYEGKEFKPVDMSQVRICPACHSKMVKTSVLGTEIDTCYSCGAIFLDKNEIDTVKLTAKKSQITQHMDLEVSQTRELEEMYREAQQEEYASDLLMDSLTSRHCLSVISSLFRLLR